MKKKLIKSIKQSNHTHTINSFLTRYIAMFILPNGYLCVDSSHNNQLDLQDSHLKYLTLSNISHLTQYKYDSNTLCVKNIHGHS